MRKRSSIVATVFCLASLVRSAGAAEPQPARPAAPIAEPRDAAFPGTILLSVDATDTDHRIFKVHETVPVEAPRARPRPARPPRRHPRSEKMS